MKIFDIGQEAEGFIAIGQLATGVIAIGQLATGVIAVGQLARGVIAVGQGAVGVLAFGQIVFALFYGGGMLGLAGIRTRPALLIYGVAGDGHLRDGGRWRPSFRFRRGIIGWQTGVRVGAAAVLAIVVVWVGLSWIPSFVEGDEVPAGPPPATFAPGTR